MEHTQLQLVDLTRNELLNTLCQHIFNDLPAHLIRIDDMKLLSRNDLLEDLRARTRDQTCTDLSALCSLEVC